MTIMDNDIEEMKKGLVLEGGAMRGLFSAGVIDVLMENGVRFDGVIGVSAGACFGCNIKSHQSGRVIRYNKMLAHDWRYASLRSLLMTGDYFGGEFDYHYMPEHLDLFDKEAFDKDASAFWCVCTDVETGKAVYEKFDKFDGNLLEYIRASASMPLASKIVKIDGRKFLDGGIADSIPLKFFQSQGYEKNVVVLTQPRGYVKEHNKFMPLMRVALRKYPNFLAALDHRHEMYNEQTAYVAEEEKQGRAFVIRPAEKLTIGHISHNPDEMQATYDLGRRQALAELDQLKSFLG